MATAAILGIIGGAFSGIGGMLLWELWLRPKRTIRSLSRAIAAETGQNLQLIFAQSVVRETNPRGVPLDFRLSRAMFDASASSIGELPPNARSLAIRMYNLVDYLNSGVLHYSSFLDARERTGAGSAERKRAERDLESALHAWNLNLDRAFHVANELNCALFAISERGRRGEKFVMADGTEIRARVVDHLTRRASRLNQDRTPG